MADRSADREMSYETTTSHPGSESDLLSSSSRPDTVGSGGHSGNELDTLTSMDPSWTVHHDLLLLSLIVTHRPVGPHKHFRILAIQHAMERGLPRLVNVPPEACRVSVASIWGRLRELYDLDALEKVDTCPDEWPTTGTTTPLSGMSPHPSDAIQLSASGDPLSPSSASISRRSARLRSSTNTATANSSASSLPSRTSIATEDLPTWDPTETFSVPLEWLPTSSLPHASPIHSPRLAGMAGPGGSSSSSSLSGSGSSTGDATRRGASQEEPPKRGRGRPKGSGVKRKQAVEPPQPEHESEEQVDGEKDGGRSSERGSDQDEEEQDDDEGGQDDSDEDKGEDVMQVDADSPSDASRGEDSDADGGPSSSDDEPTPRKPGPSRRGRPPASPAHPPPPPAPPKKRRGRPPKNPQPPARSPSASPASSPPPSSSSSSSSDLDDANASTSLRTPSYSAPPLDAPLDALGGVDLEDVMVKAEEGPVGRRTRRRAVAAAGHTDSSAPSTAPVSPTSRVMSPALGTLAVSGLGALGGGDAAVAGASGGGAGGAPAPAGVLKRLRSPSPMGVGRPGKGGRRVSVSGAGEGREGSSSPPPSSSGRRKSKRSKQAEVEGTSGSSIKRRSSIRR